MQIQLNITQKMDKALAFFTEKLPYSIKSRLLTYFEKNKIYVINELRIRVDTYIRVVIKGTTLTTDIYINEELLSSIVSSLCDNSVYAHAKTIKEGYISIGKGIRVGICGKAITENGCINALYDISSLNVRLPQKIPYAGKYVYDLLSKNDFSSSIIIFSQPGVGKTTILRDLVLRLSRNLPSSFAVIDTREEITPFLDEEITADVFLSYPKGEGITQATKVMAPKLIIIDEIGSFDEAEAVLRSVNSGVSLIATAHAKSFDELISKEIFKKLFYHNVFDYAVGVTRVGSLFNYTVNTLK